MSNAILKTESRSLRLLLVVLMASVGLSLLVGCGKKQGQVVGGGDKSPSCVGEDCKGQQRGDRSANWRYLYGETPVGGAHYGPDILLGLDVLSGGSKAEGALWVNSQIRGTLGGNNAAGWDQQCVPWGILYYCYWVPVGGYQEPCVVAESGRYEIQSWSGSLSANSIQGTVKLKSGLTLKFEKLDTLSSSTFATDPDGYGYDEYLHGSYTIENAKGCKAYGALAPPPNSGWGY